MLMHLKNIIIVGAGGFGRELLQWINDINAISPKWNVKGFIDDNLGALDGFRLNAEVIGKISEWQPQKDEVFACAIADPETKEKIVLFLKERGADFTCVVHPTAYIGDKNVVGEGFVAYPGVTVTTHAAIGDFVTVIRSGIGHDAVVGDYSTISAFCDITGGAIIGKKVFMGSHVTVIPNRKIGDGAYLSAGSVIMTDVKEHAKMMGNPAKRICF